VTNDNADIYDVMYRGSLRGDVEWYRRETGVRVTGLDLDAGMLGRLQEKAAMLPAEAQRRVIVHRGDMHARL
jgi:hypothetical protein